VHQIHRHGVTSFPSFLRERYEMRPATGFRKYDAQYRKTAMIRSTWPVSVSLSRQTDSIPGAFARAPHSYQAHHDSWGIGTWQAPLNAG
jgi:hypothetical protein